MISGPGRGTAERAGALQGLLDGLRASGIRVASGLRSLAGADDLTAHERAWLQRMASVVEKSNASLAGLPPVPRLPPVPEAEAAPEPRQVGGLEE